MNGDDVAAAGKYRIGEFYYCPKTGEVEALDGSTRVSLAPQPAALLRLLVEHADLLVSHETIRSQLWPNVTVEYDQGVHHCMRLIRAAFGDSPREPAYIETKPKRGYRLIATVVPPASPVQSTEQAEAHEPLPVAPIDASDTVPRVTRRLVMGVVVVALLLAGVLALSLLWARDGAGQASVAVMPFVSDASPALSRQVEPIATLLVDELHRAGGLAVIGPSTTRRYDPAEGLTAIVEQLEVDFLVHPRFVGSGVDESDEGARVLVEIVRAQDGAHVWTHWLDSPVDVDQATATITEAVHAHCLGRERQRF